MTDRKSSLRNPAHAPLVVMSPPHARSSISARHGDAATKFTPSEVDRIIDAVWERGVAVPDMDPAVWRQDASGAWMLRTEFNNDESPYGWKIERVASSRPGDALRPFNCAGSRTDAGATPRRA